MRTYFSRWQQGAMSFALVATCASTIHFTGCLHSSRNVSSNISEDAAQSAIDAERAIAARRTAKPADGTGERPNARSLSQYIAQKSKRYPQGDPFLDAEKPVAEKQSVEPASVAKNSDVEDRPTGSQELLDALLANQSNSDPKLKEPSDIVMTSAMEQDSGARPFPEAMKAEAPTTQRANTGYVRLSDWAKTPESTDQATVASTPKETTNSFGLSKDEPLPTVSAQKLGQWTLVKEEKAEPPAEADPVPAVPAIAKEDAESHADQFRRMTSLVELAQQQAARGEIHAAYRSALLANHIVKEHELNVPEGIASPGVVANELAAKIWGTSKRTAPIRQGHDPNLPIIQSRNSRTVQHDDVFGHSISYLNWQSSPAVQEETVEQTSEEIANSHPSELKFEWAVAETRKEAVQLDEVFDELAPAPPEDAEISLASMIKTEEIVAEDPSPESPKARPMPGFASIEKIEKEPAEAPLIAAAPLANPKPLIAKDKGKNPFAASTKNESSKQVVAVTQKSKPQIKPTEQPDAGSAASPQSSAKWGVIAFIMATLSLLIGLKMRDAKPNASAAKTEREEKSKPDSDQPPLKISKAA